MQSELLERLGATVERVQPCSIIDPNHFENVARRRADELTAASLASGRPERGFFCNQFETDSNFSAHYDSTGPEIYEEFGTELGAFVMGAGTGGTLAGTGAYLLERVPGLQLVLADP